MSPQKCSRPHNTTPQIPFFCLGGHAVAVAAGCSSCLIFCSEKGQALSNILHWVFSFTVTKTPESSEHKTQNTEHRSIMACRVLVIHNAIQYHFVLSLEKSTHPPALTLRTLTFAFPHQQPQREVLLPHGGRLGSPVDSHASDGQGPSYWRRSLPGRGHRGHPGQCW